MTLNKVSPVTMYIVNLTNSPKRIFSQTMRVIVTLNLILSLTNISPFALTKKRKLPRPCSKHRRLHNVMPLSMSLALKAKSRVTPSTRRRNAT